MKRLWALGLGAICVSGSFADQPLSVYPPTSEPRYIQLTADEVKPEKRVPAEAMPAPSLPAAGLPTAPSVSYPSYAPMTTLPGTTIQAAPYAPTQPGYVGSSAACTSCTIPLETGCVPCGTPLFRGLARPGDRPCLDQIAAWLGYRPGPRVLPVMVPNPPQHRPLHTYVTPRNTLATCANGSCAAPVATPPVFGFNLATGRPYAATLPKPSLGHLRFGAENQAAVCATCTPACGSPLFPQRCTTSCNAAPGYLTQHGYPAAQYAPRPSLLSRIFSFFTPERYGVSTCNWTMPPAPCASGPGPVMVGSSGQWGQQGSCAHGSCAAPVPMISTSPTTPNPMPQSMPQPMPQALPKSQTSGVVPGYRFATPLTQIGKAEASAVQPASYQKPVANQPFSNP